MSFFKTALASIGIGSTRVDTLVERAQLYPGEQLRGVVKIKGGEVPQDFNSIHVELCTAYLRESNDTKISHDFTLASTGIHKPFSVQPGETFDFPILLDIPLDTPVSLHKSKVWLATRLDISAAVDPRDNDPLEILTPPQIAMVLQAMEMLGFYLREVQNEHNHRFGGLRPFVQDFEFVPRSGPFRGRFDEVELYFFPDVHHLSVTLELDRKARGFSGLVQESLGTDERHARLVLAEQHFAQGVQGLVGILEQTISSHAR